jgi:hypothetical protein
VSSALSALPVARRRKVAATLGLFAMLFLAVGALCATVATSAVVVGCVVVTLLIALVLALMAWGVAQSVRTDRSAAKLESAIEDALAANGTSLADLSCGSGCGHDHDPDELVVTDDTCAHDGAGHLCSHTCETCVFSRVTAVPASAALRDGTRPAPHPRPTPGVRRPAPTRR